MKRRIFFFQLCFILMISVFGSPLTFARTPYVFKDAPPVQTLDDRKPSSVPEKNEFDLIDYSISAEARLPVVRALDPRRIKRSQDVNSMDEVPASTWYTPRLGYKTMTDEQILSGLEKIGPPQKPFRIIKAKSGGTALGFVIEDKRGHRYLIKFDEPDYPYSESSANVVVNRLYWAFGYNTPEDYLFFFSEDDFEIDLKDEEDRDIVEVSLFTTTPDEQGMYRTTASLYIDGKVLGYIPDYGTRPGDINDSIPHENLRVLRAQKIFCAWLNNSGIRGDNTLDAYKGNPGEGYTLHYMLDFGETLGAHGLVKSWRWDGFEHIASFKGIFRRALTLGKAQRWERIGGDIDDQRTFFEAETFDPATWSEVVQYAPIQHSLPDDDYWAAKILGAVKRESLEKLFALAKHPDPQMVNYWIETLMKRREKILDYFLYQVSPIESTGIQNEELVLQDMGKKLLPNPGEITYRVSYFNQKNRKVAGDDVFNDASEQFSIRIPPQAMRVARGYLRIEVRVVRDGKPVPRVAEFHIRQTETEKYRLVGIVH